MKKINKMRQAAGALTALAALIALTPSASAIVFSYEEAGGGHNIGDPFVSGGFRINLQDFDMGTVYPVVNTGTSVGSPVPTTGINLVNAIPGQVQATGARPTASPVPGLEDTWGIARIVTITDLSGRVIWSEVGKNAQLTVMFYGEQDFMVTQLANGFQNIDGVGLHADLYFQSKTDPAYTAYNPDNGSAFRTGVDTYTTVTDGQKILTTVSTAGFIHNAGTLGGLATEFNSTYNQTSGGQGQAYLSVTGGTDAAQFNTDDFLSPFGTGATADLFAQFTTIALTGAPNSPSQAHVSDWLVSSNDPIRGSVQGVPDAGSTVLMFSLGLGFLAVAYRRRRA
jgi:hypothetical protein